LQTSGRALQGINDFLELAYTLLGLAGLYWMPMAPLRGNGKWLVTLDVAVAVGGMAIVLFVTTTLVGVSAADAETRSRIVQYGIMTAGTLVALNLILVRGLARPVPAAVSFLAATAVIEVAYWVLVQLALGGIVTDKRYVDVLFGVDEVCYAMAGLSFLIAPVAEGRPALAPGWLRHFNPLPAIAVVAVGAMLTETVLTGSTTGLRTGVIGLVVLSLMLVLRAMLAARDRAHLVQLELETEQRLHAERVVAIRRFAGAIAHQYNNMMAVVLGNAEISLRQLPADHQLRESLEDIRATAHDAAEVTARLLAYAGESRASRQAMPVIDLLMALRPRVLVAGSAVTVQFDFSRGTGSVSVERELIAECLSQLVHNCRDAMTDGGRILVRLDHERIGRMGLEDAILPAPAGDYAVVEVRETGTGRSVATLQRAFDPFSSIQVEDHTHGPGLAVVHGAIASHGGGIAVRRTDGGVAIRLYLPSERPAK
jgi:signal transduction histidine kinase